MSEPIEPVDITYTDEMPVQQQPGAWPFVQPAIYVSGPGVGTVARKAVNAVGKAGGSLAMIAAGAALTAAAFYVVPRLLDGLQSDTVDLDLEGEKDRG